MIKQNPYIKKNTGKIFEFTLLKEITFTNDNTEYYIIADEKQFKFALPKKQYLHYNFKIGQKLNCRLDRINCDGKVFFEPQNPHYKENEVYEFNLNKIVTETNYLGFKEEIALVYDEYNNSHKIRYAKNIKCNNNKIKALVTFIKKGRLFLVPQDSFSKFHNPEFLYEFKIIKKQLTTRFGEVFIILDEFGNEHAIPTKYYQNYNLAVKSTFKGQIQKYSSKGFFYIEPEHPVYKTGTNYPFKVFNMLNKGSVFHVFVEDCYQNIIEVIYPSLPIIIDNKLICVVQSVSKGKPELTPLA